MLIMKTDLQILIVWNIYNIPINLVTILLTIYKNLILYRNEIIRKIPGIKSNIKGYNILVKKLMHVSLINGICVL